MSFWGKALFDLGQKVHFLKRTHTWHFHSCFLVFSYHTSIIWKQNFECILPSHLLAFSNGVIYSFRVQYGKIAVWDMIRLKVSDQRRPPLSSSKIFSQRKSLKNVLKEVHKNYELHFFFSFLQHRWVEFCRAFINLGNSDLQPYEVWKKNALAFPAPLFSVVL